MVANVRSFLGACSHTFSALIIPISSWRHKLQQIADPALQNSTHAAQHIGIQTGDFVAAIEIDLRALQFRSVTEHVFADARFGDEFGQMNTNGSVLTQSTHPQNRSAGPTATGLTTF